MSKYLLEVGVEELPSFLGFNDATKSGKKYFNSSNTGSNLTGFIYILSLLDSRSPFLVNSEYKALYLRICANSSLP